MITAMQANRLTELAVQRYNAALAAVLLTEVEAMISAAVARGIYFVDLDSERHNVATLCNTLRENGYKVEFTRRNSRLVCSWGAPT